VCLLSGGLLMGIAPVNAWPLAWVAMVPLWWLASNAVERRYSLRRALVLAGVWGVGYHGAALWWITGIHPLMWMGMSWLGSIAIALFSWVFITLWGAAIGMTWLMLMMLVSRYRMLRGVKRVVVGTALWCAVEWVWSKGPLYWTSLSYTQSPGNLWILQLGQLSGPIALTAGIVAVNGLIALVIRSLWQAESRADSKAENRADSKAESRADSKAESRAEIRNKRYLLLYPIALFVLLHSLGFGLYSYSLQNDVAQSLSVGLIQGNIPTSEKLSAAGIQASRQVYLQGYETLAEESVDLVITPEGAIPQRWNAFLQGRDPLLRAVIKRGVPLVLGTFAHREIDNNQTPLTQSLLTLTPEGTVSGRYNKVKLVPLGEYLPFEDLLGDFVRRFSPFGAGMVPGGFDQTLETPSGPVAAGICYESAFTSLFRQQVRNGGEVIFTASNNDPYPPRQMKQHHAQDVMRAVETNRWAVRVTNTGISGVVDPKGRTVWRSEPNEYVVHVADVYRRRSRTLYVRLGDWLTPLLLIISAVIVCL